MTQQRFMVQVTVGVVLSIVLVGLVIHQLQTPPVMPRRPALERLALYGPAPDFSLTERSGKPVSTRRPPGPGVDRRLHLHQVQGYLSASEAAPWPRCKRT